MINKLTSLSKLTTIVADTSDIKTIKLYAPKNVTTNPSLIFNSINTCEYHELINEAIIWSKKQSNQRDQQIIDACDKLAVNIGIKILELIPGRVSTEIDARLSYNEEACVSKARKLVKIYNDSFINNNHILIKLASTWQGIRAAERLEKEGINCNLTLLFSFAQARACAEAGVYLISPFIGRILDWYKKNTNKKYFLKNDSPGIIFVKKIYNFYKKYGYKTIIMGASIRNIDDIIELAGCDSLTIPPILLKELLDSQGEIIRNLKYTGKIKKTNTKLTKSDFFLQHNQNQMAVDELSSGIIKFSIDQEKLENMIMKLL